MVAAATALPPVSEWCADDDWTAIDFISDLHLCESMPQTFEAWAAYMRGTSADAVLILGDLFEFWPGSDATQLDFEARCIGVLAETAGQRHVGVMVGNRDFLVTPALLQGIGVHALADPTLLSAWQHSVVLTHGDALCLSDVPYQQFRAWVRDSATQNNFLARPLAERVKMGAGIRHASEASRRQPMPADGWADLDTDAAVALLRQAGARRMVHGHTHRPGNSVLSPGYDRLVLSDWDLDSSPGRAEVLRLRPQGFARIDPRQATRPG